MGEVALSAGTVEYEDTGGDGPVLVFLTGLFVGATLWRHVVADLYRDHRCVVLEMPLGAHRRPMGADADLTSAGLAGLVREFLRELDLRDVTLIGCDWGGAQLVVPAEKRVRRLILLPQESFENFPPGVPGNLAYLASRVPGALFLALQPMRVRGLRRAPVNFGLMAKRPIPDAVLDGWLAPVLGNAEIRRDVVKYLRSTRRGEYVKAARHLRLFDGPALVLWAPESRMMRRENGIRLAEALPQGRLVEIDDSYVLIPEDRPTACAREIRVFVADS
ncbi:alpha/beta hydrolase [Actinoplanes sp. NPDC051851]|uniref:alpha/beta fold hydrolase n=1 Tax=Actinoplanes sp. NPDC051851 TaxID=3154753 RepID=UPI003433CC09